MVLGRSDHPGDSQAKNNSRTACLLAFGNIGDDFFFKGGIPNRQRRKMINTEDIKLVYALAIIFTSILAIYAYWRFKK